MNIEKNTIKYSVKLKKIYAHHIITVSGSLVSKDKKLTAPEHFTVTDMPFK